jgi:hypothetical protein
MTGWSSRCVSFVLCAWYLSLGTAVDGGDVNYQKVADGARWAWSRDEASPLYCLGQLPPGYSFQILADAANRSAIQLKVIGKERGAYAWTGHKFSVFRVLNDRLFYADYSPNSSGGSIVAVDLKTGTVIWRTPLKAVGEVAHSAYSNTINMTANESVVTIYGNESAGRYVEFKDASTGKTVGHKVFEQIK